MSSALYALIIGAAVLYARSRFDYRPKIGLIATFAFCVLVAVALVAAGIPWPPAVVVAIAVYLLFAQTLGRRFTSSLANSDIAFWLISQRMLPLWP